MAMPGRWTLKPMHPCVPIHAPVAIVGQFVAVQVTAEGVAGAKEPLRTSLFISGTAATPSQRSL